MEATINIECQTVTELVVHLDKIKDQVVRKANELELNKVEDEFPSTVFLEDNNCYGSHDIVIIPA